jgi:DNA-directed RNA polymerase specialized sigma24 family protein
MRSVVKVHLSPLTYARMSARICDIAFHPSDMSRKSDFFRVRSECEKQPYQPGRIPMDGEVKSMWMSFITAPENEAYFKRYAKSAVEPEPLFERIGEDLDSSREEIREHAFWALVIAMPEITDLLHEQESRRPGWRDGKGKDQQMVNRGSDLLAKLHTAFVMKGSFKADDIKGKDPRPYVNTAIRRAEIDQSRAKRNNELSLERLQENGITPETLDKNNIISIEDEAMNNLFVEDCRKELLAWGFLDDKELKLFDTVYVNELPIDEARKRLNIPSDPALRQRISRARRKAVATRDAILKGMLSFIGMPLIRESQFRENRWLQRAAHSIKPGSWVARFMVSEEGWDNEDMSIFRIRPTDDKDADIAIRAITTAFRSAPGHLYLIAIRTDVKKYRPSLETLILRGASAFFGDARYDVYTEQGGRSILDKYKACRKELEKFNVYARKNLDTLYCGHEDLFPGYIEALNDIEQRYYVALISNVPVDTEMRVIQTLQKNPNFPKILDYM